MVSIGEMLLDAGLTRDQLEECRGVSAVSGDSIDRVILAKDKLDAVSYSGVDAALTEPDTKLLLFGKPTARPGRRMGVALAKGEHLAEARAKADRTAACIQVNQR